MFFDETPVVSMIIDDLHTIDGFSLQDARSIALAVESQSSV